MIYDLTMCNYDSDLMREWAGEMVPFLSKANEMGNPTTILSCKMYRCTALKKEKKGSPASFHIDKL